MCGRFTLSYKAEELQLSLGLTDIPTGMEPRYNIAPTQAIPAILNGKERKIDYLYWGLVPSWAKDITIGSKMINARSETIMEKPSFKSAFQRRRCLFLADGFFEWKKSKQSKSSTPFYFQLRDKSIFALAGIYDIWQQPEGGELWSGSIITCAANELVSPIHERMPVILDRETMWGWLENLPVNKLVTMMAPYNPEKMIKTEVSTRVNSANFDTPECIAPVKNMFG